MTTPHVLTILATSDLARAKAFYETAFGWMVTVQAPVYVEFSLPRGMRFGLYEHDGFARNTGKASARVGDGELTATELYFHPTDLEAAAKALEGAGAELLSEARERPWGDVVAYFRDPDGNVIAIARPPRSDDPASVAREWMRAWEQGDTSFIERRHAPGFVDRAPAGRGTDTAAFMAGVYELYAAFPDFHAEISDLLVDADAGRVTVRWAARGTWQAPFMGRTPPVGDTKPREVVFRGIEIVTVRDGQITERWGEWDGAGLSERLVT